MIKAKKIAEDKQNNKLVFELTGTDITFANALRRSIIELVPTMAIEEVKIKKNGSALYDEMLAHRLGLVPLITDLESYILPKEGEEARATTHLQLKLKAKGPGEVTASNIESTDPKVKPAQPNMLIATLLKNQSIDAEATAILGQGKDHIKWSPGLAHYKYKQTIVAKKIKNAKKISELLPPGVITVEGTSIKVNQEKLNSIDVAGALDDVKDEVTINENPEEILFTVEAWGQLSPKEMLTRGITELNAELEQLSKLL